MLNNIEDFCWISHILTSMSFNRFFKNIKWLKLQTLLDFYRWSHVYNFIKNQNDRKNRQLQARSQSSEHTDRYSDRIETQDSITTKNIATV